MMIRTPIYSNLATSPAAEAGLAVADKMVPVPGAGDVPAVDGHVLLSLDELARVVESDRQELPVETRETLTETAQATGAAGAALVKTEAAREPVRDDYLTKVVKYVPGEVLVAFLGIVAAASAVGANSRDGALWAVFAMGIVATIGYYFLSSYRQEAENQAAPYFFLLAPLSFFVWAIAISGEMRELFNIGEKMSELVLIGGAFTIPFFDEVLTLVFTRYHSRIPQFMQIPALVAREKAQNLADAKTAESKTPDEPPDLNLLPTG